MTNTHESRIKNKSLLYPELSYQIQGAVFEVANILYSQQTLHWRVDYKKNPSAETERGVTFLV